MIKAVIFDMDGLMIDSETVNYKMFYNFLKRKGIVLSKQVYCDCFTGKSIEKGLLSAKDYYQADYKVDEFFEYFNQYKEEWENQVIPLKIGLIELLNELKNKKIRIAMATSSNKERVYKIFQHYDVLSYFDDIVCGPDVKHGKPAPDIFLKACEKLGVDTEEAIVLEDSPSGIEAAYNARIKVICIPDMSMPDKEHRAMCDEVLPTLSDVINYLEV